MKHEALWFIMMGTFIGVAGTGFIYIFTLFVSVVFLGGSSACPQNLC